MRWLVAVALVAVWILLLPSVLLADKPFGISNKNSGNGNTREKEEDKQLRKATDRDDARSTERHLGRNVKASLKDLPARTPVRAEFGWQYRFLYFAYSLLRGIPIDTAVAQGLH